MLISGNELLRRQLTLIVRLLITSVILIGPAFADVIQFTFSGVINNYGNPNSPNDNPYALPIPIGTPFSVDVSFDGPLAVGLHPVVVGSLTATIGSLHATLTNPLVSIILNHSIGPFSGLDVLEFDPTAPAIVSGDSVNGWAPAGVFLDFYGPNGQTSISNNGVAGPIDVSQFNLREFTVVYANPVDSHQGAFLDSLSGSPELLHVLWPGGFEFGVPEPFSFFLVAPCLIAIVALYLRKNKMACRF